MASATRTGIRTSIRTTYYTSYTGILGVRTTVRTRKVVVMSRSVRLSRTDSPSPLHYVLPHFTEGFPGRAVVQMAKIYEALIRT